jgi:hypothetical protein
MELAGEVGTFECKQTCVMPNKGMNLWRLVSEVGFKQTNNLAYAVFTPFALQKGRWTQKHKNARSVLHSPHPCSSPSATKLCKTAILPLC